MNAACGTVLQLQTIYMKNNTKEPRGEGQCYSSIARCLSPTLVRADICGVCYLVSCTLQNGILVFYVSQSDNFSPRVNKSPWTAGWFSLTVRLGMLWTISRGRNTAFHLPPWGPESESEHRRGNGKMREASFRWTAQPWWAKEGTELYPSPKMKMALTCPSDHKAAVLNPVQSHLLGPGALNSPTFCRGPNPMAWPSSQTPRCTLMCTLGITFY